MTDVVMPQMGESIVEGTLTRWLKKAGDHVERDEPLFEISTDKVDTEIPSPVAGVLSEILVEAGKTVAINTVVARIGGAAAAPAPAAAAPPPAPAAPPPAAAAAPIPAPPPPPAPVAAKEDLGPLSPLVRKMARENEVDLTTVAGTGAGGRITKQDVEGALQSKAAPPAPAAPATTPAPAVAATAAPAYAPPPPRSEAPKVRVEPMSTMRKKIAEHMIHSKQTSAHVTTVHKVDMTNVAKVRDKAKGAFQAQYGFSLTFLSFVAAATAKALREFPILNASIDGGNIIYHSDINLGIAVALDNGSGLIVPVIAQADEKNVTGLQRSIVDLAARARSRQLKPDEVKGGTFAITNFGSFGSVFATPVINQPNVGILGVGTIEKTPVVINDGIAIRSICYLALTFDHRLIDGALADMFTGRVKQILENWTDSVL
ncbi:MAG: 2-oxoglutarate dehydrogenase, E2 component, dihydrolipoamide succinyltransferase [Acidobacteria bacterium]|nr:2-oxoglutarate dehydrogenase, E2 component, dihydrolipoamide succinyltransferase [Acidobacteriota bacterium]